MSFFIFSGSKGTYRIFATISTLSDMLRDRLVCGIHDDCIQRALLAQSKLTLDKAFELAIGLETVEMDANDLKQAVPIAATVGEPVMSIPSGKERMPKGHRNSYRCGRNNHDPNDCFYKGKVCRGCGKLGHIEKVCRSK